MDFEPKIEEIKYLDSFACPQIYQRMYVAADGTAFMCGNDEMGGYPIGDAKLHGIHEIWHGEKLNAVRKKHLKPCGYMDVPVCTKCYLPRATVEDESAEISGLVFNVPNYVNAPGLVAGIPLQKSMKSGSDRKNKETETMI